MANGLAPARLGRLTIKVTIYSLPAGRCVACRFTERDLDRIGVDYKKVHLDQDPQARDHVAAQGVSTAPYVEVDLGEGASWSWSGYRPSQLERLRDVMKDVQVLQ